MKGWITLNATLWQKAGAVCWSHLSAYLHGCLDNNAQELQKHRDITSHCEMFVQILLPRAHFHLRKSKGFKTKKKAAIICIATGSLSHIHYPFCITHRGKVKRLFLSFIAKLLTSGIKIRPDCSPQDSLPPALSYQWKKTKQQCYKYYTILSKYTATFHCAVGKGYLS